MFSKFISPLIFSIIFSKSAKKSNSVHFKLPIDYFIIILITHGIIGSFFHWSIGDVVLTIQKGLNLI